tara:strand:+ start:389 stop:736 length:348 start_codon:yes stop_codon:yes gene_type:complete
MESLLNDNDINLIESTNLSTLEKHHLRLLAHCLETLRLMANGSLKGSFPTKEKRLTWFKGINCLQDDQSFIPVLMEQLDVAAIELEKMAELSNISPLEMNLSSLIQGLRKIEESF